MAHLNNRFNLLHYLVFTVFLLLSGRLGTDRITVQNLVVLKIDTQRDLLYVKGAVPGTNGEM